MIDRRVEIHYVWFWAIVEITCMRRALLDMILMVCTVRLHVDDWPMRRASLHRISNFCTIRWHMIDDMIDQYIEHAI